MENAIGPVIKTTKSSAEKLDERIYTLTHGQKRKPGDLWSAIDLLSKVVN
ncbi:MAG: hypothetical protein OQJ91_11570 [Motiliproteus sp.]|nr:hypothetical protein [Motiliproteus sp.]